MTSHSSIGLSAGSPAYTAHNSGHTGRNGPTGGHTGGHGTTHGPATSMHAHQSLQSDFQPPYFPRGSAAGNAQVPRIDRTHRASAQTLRVRWITGTSCRR